MKIKGLNGTYWNAENKCFGPLQAATEYDYYLDLPVEVEYCGETAEIAAFAPGDIRYYILGDNDAIASAV